MGKCREKVSYYYYYYYLELKNNSKYILKIQ